MKHTALALMATGVFLLSCGCEKRPPPSEWNLLWVVIDDLKAGHLGYAGYQRDVTPETDDLARSGVYFQTCITQAPWSLPSYASMLSSRYPCELVLGDAYLKHVRGQTDVARSRDPARMPEFNTHWYVPVPHDTPLMAELLEDRGFITAAWVNNAWLSPGKYGLERGFSHYFDGVGNQSPYTPADELACKAIKWIQEHKNERWFAFVQFMDPHKPYRDHGQNSLGKRYIDLYDAEIRSADKALGSLVRTLHKLGLKKRTVVVLSSDHGEGVFEDDSDFVGHGGGVLPEIVHVPLVIRWPRGPKGHEVKALCRNLDIMPTLLDLLGIPAPDGIKGRSLVNEAKNEAGQSDQPAFTMGVFKGPEQVSLIVQGREPPMLYQLVSIPAYGSLTFNVIPGSGQGPGDLADMIPAMRSRLQGFMSGAQKNIRQAKRGLPPDLDRKTIKNLKTLGYFE